MFKFLYKKYVIENTTHLGCKNKIFIIFIQINITKMQLILQKELFFKKLYHKLYISQIVGKP